MPELKSETDWDRVRSEAAADAPVVYDPEDDCYDPNDEAAVKKSWGVTALRDLTTAPGGRYVVPVRLSSEVIEHFRKEGDDWQAAVDAVLRDFVARADR